MSRAHCRRLCGSVGVDSVLITPCYLQTKGEHLWHTAIDDLPVEWRGRSYQAKAFYSEANGSPTFLIDYPPLFHRDSIYGYTEDYERFAFFNHAALALIKRLGQPPDIVHLNDWHCGFAAVEIAHFRLWDHIGARRERFSRFTIWLIRAVSVRKNFGNSVLQANFERNAFAFNGYASAMKAGLAVSDMLSTVSRRYGQEMQTAENGYGLDWLLRQRSNRLYGIINGVDYETWNPETDPALNAHFNRYDIDGKPECKRALLEQFSLPVNLEKPIFASVTRLTSQKGFELIQQIAGELLATGAYFIALGSGDKNYENFLQAFRDYAPNQVGVYVGYNEDLAHLIEAGADMFLMPSRFEPCGLNQMYSLRYGTIPIVRAVGGLDDTVQNFDVVAETGNGFKFKEFRADKFLEKIYESLFAYYDKDAWRKLQWNGMTEDNSWENAARKYVALYSAVQSA